MARAMAHDAEDNGSQNAIRFVDHGLSPLQKIGAALVEQDDLLSQGNRRTGDLLEARRQHIELLPFLIWLAWPGCSGWRGGCRGALALWLASCCPC